MEEDQEVKPVGFWYSESEPDLPMPVANAEDYPNGPIFRTVLTMIQLRISNSQREAEPLGSIRQFKGLSPCRLCKEYHGSATYELGGFVWPSGYLHYLGDHFVRPDPAFAQFIKDWAREHMTKDGKPLIVE